MLKTVKAEEAKKPVTNQPCYFELPVVVYSKRKYENCSSKERCNLSTKRRVFLMLSCGVLLKVAKSYGLLTGKDLARVGQPKGSSSACHSKLLSET